MTVPALRVAAAFLTLAAVFGATACTPTPAPAASPTVTPTPTATPTPEALVVDPGVKPPTVFGGDCDAAVPSSDLTALVASDLRLVSSRSNGDVGNVGGLVCTWEGEPGVLTVEMLPLDGLDGATLSAAEQKYYFEDCDPNWVCSWNGTTDELWIAASFQFQGMTREAVDAWGAAIGGDIDEHYTAWPSETWTRDRTGWWPVLDCEGVARGLGEALGDSFAGESVGYPDPPRPGYMIAAIASQRSGCMLTSSDPSVRPIELYSSAGTAWTLPTSSADEQLDTGVTGTSAWRDSGYESMDSEGYSLTDGVNALQTYVPTTGPWSGEEILAAIAAGAASGWE